MAKRKHPRKLKIVDAILESDIGQEGKALGEFIKMTSFGGVDPVFVRGNDPRDRFLHELFSGRQRYLHISAHGGENALYIHGRRETPVTSAHVKEFINAHEPKPLLGRFVTISACGDIGATFASEFGSLTGALAVVSPLTDVLFAESLAFYSVFYFALGNHPLCGDRSGDDGRLAQFIDTFQRAKMAYLMLGGSGAHRLNYWTRGEHQQVL